MWVMLFFVLSTGYQAQYKDTYHTAQECVKAREVVVQQILKDNPQVPRTEKFDGTGDFLLVCSKPKESK